MEKICSFFYEVCSFVLGLGALLRWKVGSFFILGSNSIRKKWIGPLVYGLKDSLDITEFDTIWNANVLGSMILICALFYVALL